MLFIPIRPVEYSGVWEYGTRAKHLGSVSLKKPLGYRAKRKAKRKQQRAARRGR